MPDGPQPVVTLKGIELRPESVAPREGSDADPVEAALAINRYTAALEKLREETQETDPDVFVTATDRDTSLLQSRVADHAGETAPLASGGKEVKFGPGLEDPFGWAKSLWDWVDQSEDHAIMRPGSTTPELVPDDAAIALLSDWATGLYGAPVSAATLAATGGFDVLMHLGDVYYSGTETETASRFLDLWPESAATTSRALNGNHEMYSGGHGYFASTLPAFSQASSYFAMRNASWLLIGLDTAYVDHDIDAEQAGWVHNIVKEHGAGRRVLLFSHHQLFSRLGSQGPRLRAALDGLLRSGIVAAWYWGHEHDCILYDAHPRDGLLGRCVGNGGVPEPRKKEVREAPGEQPTGNVSWRRLGPSDEAPGCVVLDGPNAYVKGKEEKFAPHGYATLAFDGAELTERIHLPDGTAVFEQTIT